LRLLWRSPVRRLALAVDADGVHEHFALADRLLELADRRAARRIFAIRDHTERLLEVPALLSERDRFSDGVVHRRAAAGRDRAQRAAQPRPLRRPALQEHWEVAEAIEEDFILRAQQIVEEAIERRLRFLELGA